MVKISIIIPVYNQEHNVNMPLCIESVVTQTFTDFELILINDGSTDKSGDRCDAFAQQDKRISVIHREQHDLGGARNTGITHASGEFIAFVECDDFIHEAYLQILYKKMRKTDADVAVCDFQPIEEGTPINEKRRKKALSDSEVTVCSGKEALHGMYDAERVFTVPWSKLYRKVLFDTIKYPEGYVDEDEFIAHRLLYEARTVVHVHIPLYYYVIAVGRKGSYSPIPMTEKKFDKMLALYERAVFFRKRNIKAVEDRALLHFAEHFFWFYLQSQKELPGAVVRRKEIRKLYNRLFFRLIRNSQLNNKKKIVYSAFRISPSLHKFLLSRGGGKKLVKQS